MLSNNINSKISLSTLACAISLILSPSASAILIDENNDAMSLANSLIIPGTGVEVTSASLSIGIEGGFEGGEGFDGEFEGEFPINQAFAAEFIGPNIDIDDDFPPQNAEFQSQSGTWTNESGTYGLPSEGGIVLSSGFVKNYEDGENTSSSFSSGAGTAATQEQNDLLADLSGQNNHFDPIQLDITFDVTDDIDTISFIAAFGSEEFPEFVNSSFNDAFGMFLNGELVSGVLPTGGVDGDPLLPVNIDHPDFKEVVGTELNGLLAPNDIPLLRFDIPVEPGSVGNTFSIVIADASDSGLDSTVFLSSFGNFDDDSGNSEFTPILPDPSNPTNEDGAFVFELPELEEDQTIWIDPDVATGYVYTTDGEFNSVTAPTLLTVNDSDGYTIHYLDEFGNPQSFSLLPGETLNFLNGVSTFTLDGIDPLLGLDPTNNAAFALGVSFNQNVGSFVTQNPIITYIPDANDVAEPTTLAIFGLSLAGLISLRRRKQS